MKLNRKLVLILALVLSVALATGGTLAYLSDTDADVNVMTLGNVYIVQNEQQRDENGDLEPFENNKVAYPAVGPVEWADEGVTLNGTEYLVFTDELKNVIDKFVTVTNTGNTDAYVRTIVALEAPDYDPNDLIHVNVSTTGLTNTAWAPVEIDGVKYVYSVFTYTDALAAKATSQPSLMQLFLDSKATNADVAKFGDTWEVLVLSQAVQANGFADAATALDTAFNAATAENVESWFTGWSDWTEGEEIGSPGDKNDTNNPPVIMPTTSWDKNADDSWYNADESSFTIDSAAELAGFAKLVNEGGKNFSGKTVKLAANIDLGDHLWIPVGQTGATEFKGVFDGNGMTISNLYIDSSDELGGHYSSGLFGWLENHGSGITVKNVTIDGAVVKGNHNTGVIAGYVYGTIENCTVKNAEVVCAHANDDACGDKAGVIAGYAGDGHYTNNKAVNCTVTAGRDAGQLFGCIINSQKPNFVGNTAENVTVSATGDCTGKNINNDIFGRITGN